jgi:hypothetical protein
VILEKSRRQDFFLGAPMGSTQPEEGLTDYGEDNTLWPKRAEARESAIDKPVEGSSESRSSFKMESLQE